MRSLTIHPVSLALGIALGGIALLSMSQAIVASSPVRIEYAPHPRDLIQIRYGTPFTVPLGKVFVATALGSSEFGYAAQLQVNGQVQLDIGPSSNRPSMDIVPPGFTAPAGSTIQVGAQFNEAWGYLASDKHIATHGATIRVPFAPHPNAYFRIQEPNAFTVPPGKVFVPTGINVPPGPSAQARLRVDGLDYLEHSGSGSPSYAEVPLGMTAQSGSVVEVVSALGSNHDAEVWGYLADK